MSRRKELKTCPRCGETKYFYDNNPICKACLWWGENHNGEKRTSPKRIRDGLKSSHFKEYTALRSARGRCFNKNNAKYPQYGGRGIAVCDRWMGADGFHNFYHDMGDCPKGYSLDRIDVDGDYCPANCRWADTFTQANNKQDRRRYSKRVGVTFNKANSYWIAQIMINGKHIVKYAKTEGEAIQLRQQLEEMRLSLVDIH